MTSEVPGTSGRQFKNDLAKVVPIDELYAGQGLHNISVQTGEEFSTEFLRDRATPRRVPLMTDMDQRQPKRVGFNFVQNNQMVYEDLTGLLGIRRRDSESGTYDSDISSGKVYAAEEEQKGYSNMGSRYHRDYSASGQQLAELSDEVNFNPGPSFHASESPHSYQPFGYGSGVSDGSFPGKIKFLCSFGGRILPRPSDGKLRYVGGETRIISIRKNLTYSELVRKTSAICIQPHSIKYQLPGEDLDALISVSSDEDLHHMLEEYHDLERGSQRLRIFLVSSGETDSPCSFESRTVQQSDPDYQYLVAVNGMLDPSPRRSSSGHSLSSQASQWGSTFDNSPTFQRDSPTSFHPLEVREAGSSPNLTMMLSNPTSQFFNTPQNANKSYSQSPPLSPVPGQHRDPKNARMQMYEDHAFADGHNSPRVMDQPAYDNSYNFDAPSHYYNQLHEPRQVMHYHHHNKRLIEPNQAHEMRFHNRSPSDDFIYSALYSQNDMDFGRSIVNEMGLQSEKFLSSPEDTRGPFRGSDISVGSLNKMSHVQSDSQLHCEERSNYPLEQENISWYPLDFKVEKSPSLTLSTSSRECQMQQQEISGEKCESSKYENMPTFKPGDYNKEYTEWGQDMLMRMGKKVAPLSQDAKFYDEKGNPVSNAVDMEHNLINFYENSIPRLEQQELKVPEGTNSVYLATAQEDFASTMRERPNDYDFNPSAPEFLNKDVVTGTIRTVKGSDGSSGGPGQQLLVVQGMNGQEPILANPVYLTAFAQGVSHSSLNLYKNDPPVTGVSTQNPGTNAALGREISHLGEGPVKHRSNSVGQVGSQGHISEGSKLGDAIIIRSKHSDIYSQNNVSESAVIVEDVTDSIPSDVPSSSKIVPYVEYEPNDEIHSPRGTETESVAPESDFEDVEGDGKDKDESISDAAIAEMEAGIYGLQIIKNADLEELHELGSGTFGTVYHGKWRGTDVAIKRIKKSCFAGRSSEQERLIKDFWREAQILSKLHHPNVLAFYGVVPDGPGGTLATVTEYMANGSLRHVLLKKDRKVLDRRKKLMIAMDAAFGMEYLHLKNIVHFDLKCDNLLVNLGDPQRPICKVGDFGLSRIKRNTLVSGGVRGTLPWMAPELLNGSSSRVSEKVDVFSFGIAMWEILTGEEPYADMHCGAIIGGIVSNTLRPSIPDHCNAEWRKLMEDCWSPDPTVRPSFTEITNGLRVMSMALQPKRHNPAKR
ncbi:Serine/threonine-protein kinase CTR1 [Camellia lanceoleosa]|uniref:Serine/threonine-protein kinase CTR1 n=1 Tax=Camellia lanceoleosa TaxID=1840588 RepID=A0ACC0GZ34_9ERIC|nr:Serine/threonine-protein kinase CTR1 [Camellia lanceoleosa]